MGGFANYTNPGGNYRLDVGTSGGGGGSFDDMNQFYMDMARRRMEMMENDRNRRIRAEDRARFTRTPALAGRDAGMDELQRAQARAEILKLQAAERPAPKRTVSGPQIIPGDVLDDLAMNAYQRQLFLPSGSSFTGGPTGTETSRRMQLEGETEMGLAEEAERRRRNLSGGSGNPERRADWSGLGTR